MHLNLNSLLKELLQMLVVKTIFNNIFDVSTLVYTLVFSNVKEMLARFLIENILTQLEHLVYLFCLDNKLFS